MSPGTPAQPSRGSATLRPLGLLLTIGFMLYPALVYYAMRHFPSTGVALAVLLGGGLRLLAPTNKALPGSLWFAVAAMVAALLSLVSNTTWGVKCYPVFVNALMLALFTASVVRPPSAIERLARLRQPDLPPQAVVYTRKVTLVWCVFFAFNGFAAAVTVFLDDRIWALYNGVIAYVLMGLLLAIEWLVRPKRT